MRNEAALVARALRREMRQEREEATALNYERKPDSFPACAECRHEWQYSHLGVTTCLQCRQRLDDEKPGLVTADLESTSFLVALQNAIEPDPECFDEFDTATMTRVIALLRSHGAR